MTDAESALSRAERLVAACLRGELTLSVAESLTGGAIASALVSVPGASQVFPGAVVAYSVQSKTRDLAVDAGLIADHGVVSEPVALAMAQGVAARFGASVGVATTGVAGPDAVGEIAVGTVCIAVVAPGVAHVETFAFDGGRERVRGLARDTALLMALDAVTSR